MNKFKEALLEEKVKTLENDLKELRWIIKNPPIYKYGDKVFIIDKHGSAAKTPGVVKNSGTVNRAWTEMIIEFERIYTIDNGFCLTKVDEIYLDFRNETN
jgi:hypothetical protein